MRTETWAHGCPWAGDREVEVFVGKERLTACLKKDRPLPHTVYDRADSFIGMVDIGCPGECEISVRNRVAGECAQYYDLVHLRLSSQTEPTNENIRKRGSR